MDTGTLIWDTRSIPAKELDCNDSFISYYRLAKVTSISNRGRTC